MAKNPMQRKAQNSFLLGILVTLLITGIIIAFLFMQLTKVNKEMEEQKASRIKVCVLNTDATSGQIITEDMLTLVEVDKSTIPGDSFGNDASKISTYSLEDSMGNPVKTVSGETVLEIQDTDGQTKNRVIKQSGDYYYLLEENGTGNYVFINEDGQLYIEEKDGSGQLVTDATGNTKKCIIEQASNNDYYYTGNYYYIETSETTNQNQAIYDTKADIKTTELNLTTTPVIAKIDMKANTVITESLITKSDERVTADLRKVEYNMITLPTQLETNSYVDIRLRLPDGADYTVLTRKRVTIPAIEGVESLSTISLNLTEIEILTLGCAIVESYKIEGSLLYVTEYVEPGIQEDVTSTYVPDNTTLLLIQQNPNKYIEEARQALWNRLYQVNSDGEVVMKKSTSETRQPINDDLNENAEDATDNVIDKLEEEIEKKQEERQKYLDSLGGY